MKDSLAEITRVAASDFLASDGNHADWNSVGYYDENPNAKRPLADFFALVGAAAGVSPNYYPVDMDGFDFGNYSNAGGVWKTCGAQPMAWAKKSKKEAWRECQQRVRDSAMTDKETEQELLKKITQEAEAAEAGGLKIGTIIGISIGAIALLGLGTWALIKARGK